MRRFMRKHFGNFFGKSPESHARNNQGFSVIEMLLVFTVVALAMMPLASIQFSSRQQITEADRQTAALQVAQERIERARMAGFANAAPDSGQVGVFTFVTTITPDPANPFLQEIETTVSWEYGAEQRNVTLASKQAAR